MSGAPLIRAPCAWVGAWPVVKFDAQLLWFDKRRTQDYGGERAISLSALRWTELSQFIAKYPLLIIPQNER
ncbi:MAG: hypothetical protein NVS1B11_25400 [Terriglobales bacterium]